MLLAVLFSNEEGNILMERFHGVPAEERLHWRSFLVKLGADNLKGGKNEELLVASHKSVYIVYTVLGNICIYVVGKDEYDELALAEVIFAITTSVKDACASKAPTERIFLEKYGKICLCLDEIVWMGMLENTDKDRVRRLTRLKPLAEGSVLSNLEQTQINYYVFLYIFEGRGAQATDDIKLGPLTKLNLAHNSG